MSALLARGLVVLVTAVLVGCGDGDDSEALRPTTTTSVATTTTLAVTTTAAPATTIAGAVPAPAPSGPATTSAPATTSPVPSTTAVPSTSAPAGCPPGTASPRRASGVDSRVCLRLEPASTTVRAGGTFEGTLIVENRSGETVSYTQPDGCPTDAGLFKDGRRVTSPAICTQQFVGEVPLPPRSTRRLPVSVEVTDDRGRPLPAGAYEARARVNTTSADGDWSAPPVRVTVVP